MHEGGISQSNVKILQNLLRTKGVFLKMIIKSLHKSWILTTIAALSIMLNVYLMVWGKQDETREEIFERNYTKFIEYTGRLIEEFQYDGYKEILGERSHMLALPLNKPEDEFIGRQKLFIYINDSKNTIIIVSLTASQFNHMDNDEWTHSFDYTPWLLKDNNNETLPVGAIASNSFNKNGCNFTLLAFSHYNGESVGDATQELIHFSNVLVTFLE